MIGFIGIGNMGGAILSGITDKGACRLSDVGLYDAFPAQYARFEGAKTYESARALAEKEEVIFFSVKPQVLPDVLETLRGMDTRGKLFITICAAISTDFIRSYLPGAHVVRAMPNTPMLYGKGVCALSRGAEVTDAEFERAKELFSLISTVGVIPEKDQNAVIAVTGSSPAYLFALADAMADNAEKSGFSREESVKWIAGVFEGAAAMLRKSGKTPHELCEMVCSPGGTTLAAMKVFEDAAFSETVDQAMDACTRRAGELAK